MFPIEYDENIYKTQNPHLIKFSSKELFEHYSFYGKKEGLTSCSIENRIMFFDLVEQDKNILEIGPLCFPLSNGQNKKTLDYFTTDELKENYKNDKNVDIEKIVSIDYCIKDVEKYSDVIDITFDYCISSHNIEHTPCMITFLNNVSSVLKKDGLFFLAIPDYRFCFDHFRNPTTILDVLNAYYTKRKMPDPLNILENKFMLTHNFSIDHWNEYKKSYTNMFVGINNYESFLNNKKDEIINNIEAIKNIIGNKKYIDSHCWKLTPFIFSYIIDILNKTGLINLSICRLYNTLKNSNEFYTILKKN